LLTSKTECVFGGLGARHGWPLYPTCYGTVVSALSCRCIRWRCRWSCADSTWRWTWWMTTAYSLQGACCASWRHQCDATAPWWRQTAIAAMFCSTNTQKTVFGLLIIRTFELHFTNTITWTNKDASKNSLQIIGNSCATVEAFQSTKEFKIYITSV